MTLVRPRILLAFLLSALGLGCAPSSNPIDDESTTSSTASETSTASSESTSEHPATSSFSTTDTTPSEDPSSGTPSSSNDSSESASASTTEESSSTAPSSSDDDTTDSTHDQSGFARIKFRFGGTSGPCGPINDMIVDATGYITTSQSDDYPPEGETECPPPRLGSGRISPDEARTLIDNVTADFNVDHTTTEECDGAFEFIRIFSETAEVGVSDNLSCSDDMQESTKALHDIWAAVVD